MRIRQGIALLALVAAVGAAAAQRTVPAGEAREISARAAERGVPAGELLAVVGDAAARGVPTDLVTAKVLEGLSKHVPPGRVAAVARALTDRLDRAQAALADATKAGLGPPSDRRAALADLGDAFASGLRGQDLVPLVDAARAGGRGGDDFVAAAHTQGELARRGVTPPDSLPLGVAIARHGAQPAGEIPALFDAWRAEGGKNPRAFVGEASRRIEDGLQLDGMVDVFAESPDHLTKDNGAKDNGEGLALGKNKQTAGHGGGPPAVPPGKAKGRGKK
jgi:hypothetical protein